MCTDHHLQKPWLMMLRMRPAVEKTIFQPAPLSYSAEGRPALADLIPCICVRCLSHMQPCMGTLRVEQRIVHHSLGCSAAPGVSLAGSQLT